MIITLETTDLPNTCGFVGHPLLQTHLQYIKPEGLSSVLHSQVQAHKVCFAHSHPQRTDHASQESLDNLRRGPG